MDGNWMPAARGARGSRAARGSRRRPAAGGEAESGGAPGDAEEVPASGGGLVDPGRFEGLVAEHSGALHGYLARRAPHAADDLLAEVWLRAFAGRTGYDPARGAVRVWLFGVARHVLAAHWRDAGRGEPPHALDAEPYADPWQAVDQRLDAAAVAPLIRRTLRELPHVERELLLLVAWEQLTPAEAAAVVGVPQGTARSRLHRARARLREALRDAPAGSPTNSTAPTGSTTPTGMTGERS
jgi:RNA polymerase sigma-70 factor (ECF subfamily)